MEIKDKFSKPFNVRIYKENGYRLNITHQSFKGRIRNRIGDGNEKKHESLIMHLKVELEKHFLNEEITKPAVKEFVKNFVELYYTNTASIFNYFNDFIAEKKDTKNKKTKKIITKSAIQVYERSLKLFKEYLIKKNIKPYPQFMDKKVLDNFYDWLKGEHNYRVKLHGKIKNYFKFLNKKGFSINPTFEDSNYTEEYDNQQPKDNDKALTENQLYKLLEFRKVLNDKNYEIKPYKQVKTIKPELQEYQRQEKLKNLRLSLDCFLFMCATGQYHADIINSKLDIKQTINRNIHCSYRRSKNNSKCIGISLENHKYFIAKELIIQYKIENNGNFPYPLSLNTLKKHLNEISNLAEMDIEIKSRMARKTFATRLYYDKDFNLDIKYIQKLLGHASIKTTYKYLRITDDDVADEISEKLNQC